MATITTTYKPVRRHVYDRVLTGVVMELTVDEAEHLLRGLRLSYSYDGPIMRRLAKALNNETINRGGIW